MLAHGQHREGAMTLASESDTGPVPDPTPERLVPLKAKVALAAFAVALFGFICYVIGTDQGTGSYVLTGRAYVGPDQASVTVGGRAYGFEISPNGMRWYDARGGGSHDGGIPPCLQHPGYAWIRFGYAKANGLDGQSSWRVVTWVQCIDHV
jgi:hypothetical protein